MAASKVKKDGRQIGAVDKTAIKNDPRQVFSLAIFFRLFYFYGRWKVCFTMHH
jgi:hypothetical protein